MGFVFGLLIIGIMTLGGAILFKKEFVEVIPVSVMLIVFIFYITGIMGILDKGFFVVGGILLVSIVYIVKNHNMIKPNYYTIIGIVGIIIFICIVNNGRYLIAYDEFSHWGLAVKNMLYFDALGSIEKSSVLAKSYPPGLSIIQYFFCKFNNVYDESLLLKVNAFLIWALMIQMTGRRYISKTNEYIKIILILFFIPILFWEGYTILYADCILGLVLGYVFLSYYFYNDKDFFSICKILLGIMMLVLTKNVGKIYVVVFVFAIVLDNLYDRTIKKKQIVFIGLFSFLSFGIWYIYLKIIDISFSWKLPHSLVSDIFNLLHGEPRYRVDIIEDFIEQIFRSPDKSFVFGISIVGWMLIIWLVNHFFIKVNIIIKRRLQIMNIVYLLGFCIMLGGLLCAYLFLFTAAEGSALAHMSRYINSYILGGIVISLFELFFVLNNVKDIKLQKFLYVLVYFLLFCISYEQLKRLTVGAEFEKARSVRSFEERRGMDLSNFDIDFENSKVFIVSQEEGNDNFVKLVYENVPLKLKQSWYLEEYNAYELEEILKSYNYIFLYKLNDQFYNLYDSIFEKVEIEEKAVYHIDIVNDKVKLTMLEVNERK